MILKTSRARVLTTLGTGVLLSSFFFYSLHQSKQEWRAQQKMTTVVVAKSFIKTGRLITPDLVEEISVPQAYLQPLALLGKKELLNQKEEAYLKTRVGLMKGEHLTRSKLIDEKSNLSLSWLLEPGETAASFRFEPEKAVGGWIQPGDQVNVYCTVDKQPDWPQTKTRLLLAHVQVLAVQGVAWDPGRPLTKDNLLKPIVNESQLITLKLSPEEVALANLAETKGKLALALVTTDVAAEKPWVSATMTDLR